LKKRKRRKEKEEETIINMVVLDSIQIYSIFTTNSDIKVNWKKAKCFSEASLHYYYCCLYLNKRGGFLFKKL